MIHNFKFFPFRYLFIHYNILHNYKSSLIDTTTYIGILSIHTHTTDTDGDETTHTHTHTLTHADTAPPCCHQLHLHDWCVFGHTSIRSFSLIRNSAPTTSSLSFSMAERLDLIIFGATGFTGKHVVQEAERLAKEKHFTWAVAGRRKEALESILKEFAPESENIKVIIADLKDEKSLEKMAEQAKVIVNCCGPYRFYGEPVIKACIAARTHHVDVSGEPQYMEKMQLEYNKAAQEAGVYIISACGFDSIPADLGLIFTQNKFEGDVNSVETYLNFWSKSSFSGAVLHYGTWESAVYGLRYAYELRGLRTKLFPERLPEFKPKLKTKGVVHRSAISEGWSVVFPGSDRSVCLRTQRFLFQKYKQRPAQVQAYVTFKSLFQVIQTAIIGSIFTLLTKSEFGCNLLLKYPKFFSGGVASHEGPKPEYMKNSHFSVTFIAKGWTDKLSEPTDQHKDAPNKEMITKVSGTNPGYGATCTAVLFSALMILKESDKMPDNGGVLSPGAALGKTSIIHELNNNGFKFEVISSIENENLSANPTVLRSTNFKMLSKL